MSYIFSFFAIISVVMWEIVARTLKEKRIRFVNNTVIACFVVVATLIVLSSLGFVERNAMVKALRPILVHVSFFVLVVDLASRTSVAMANVDEGRIRGVRLGWFIALIGFGVFGALSFS